MTLNKSGNAVVPIYHIYFYFYINGQIMKMIIFCVFTF